MIMTSRKVNIFLRRQAIFFITFTLLLLGAIANQAEAESDTLLHNSINLGTKYGSWGVAGGTYGEFICTTCHRTTTDNVKRVFGSIPATIGPNVVKTVIFNNMTGFGDDSVGHATSVRICEVCHTATTAHQYNTANAPQSGDLTHENGDCTICHEHSAGFKATSHFVPLWGTTAGHAVCASGIGCHLNSNPAAPYPTVGDPVPAPDCRACHTKADPTVSSNGCGSCHGLANGNGEPSGTVHPDAAGSHPVHTPLASCTECHDVGGTGGNANHGMGNRGENPAVVNLAASYAWDGTACATASCHANVYSPTGNIPSPAWGTAAGCEACHTTAIGVNGPATGAHVAHAGKACTSCHNLGTTATTSPTTAHADGDIDINAGGYPVNITKHAAGSYIGTCSNIYCHSSGQSTTGGATPVYAASPDWSATSTTCGSCHLNFDSNASATGDHVKHAQTNSISCATCHNGYSETTVAAATHVNNIIELSFNGNAAGTSYSQGSTAVGNGYGTCSSSYCHSTGQSTTGGATPTYPATPPTWGTTVTNCSSCHLDFDSSASATGDHVKHAQSYPFTCATCHSGYTESSVNSATHVNKLIELTFSGNAAGTSYSQGSTAVGNGYGTCSTSYCHSTGQSTTGGATPTYPATPPTWGTTVTNCGSCHLNFDSNASATGDHVKHAQGTANFSCATCHNGYTETTAATATHVNKTIELTFSGTYGTGTTYSQGNGAVGLGYGNCSASKCHGQGAPVWGGALYSTSVQCENCHGSAATSPFYSTAASGAAPTKVTAETDSKVGAHLPHLTARAAYTNAVACTECHAAVGSLTAAGHMNGSATPTFSGDAILNGASPTYATSTCSNTYCHGARMIGGSTNGSDTSPTWTNTAYLTGTPSKTGDCAMCHGCPPNTSDHGTETLAECNGCHNHVTTSGTFTAGANRALHINGIIESQVTCVGCHAVTQTGTHGTPRAAVVGEFTLAWGHKKTGRGAVTDADCIVCHLEGVFSTQAPSATYHKDGNIDLRDPDGANGEIRITNISGGAFTFTRFATSYNSGDRTSTGHTANTVDNVITQKFCLKCHDAGGATNNTARAGSSPTATAPFGGGFTALNTEAQFATSNNSKHPVLGPLTKDYPTAARMAVPYKPTGTRGTSGTKTAGVVMNCFDCHNTPTTPLTTRTVSAHGNNNGLRGTIAVASPTLCAVCHLTYTNNPGHGTGSAFTISDTKMTSLEMGTCEHCHSSSTAATRPTRAENYHGVNTVPAGSQTKIGRWAAGGVPVSFIRNSNNLPDHAPKKVGVTTYTPTCMDGGGTANACNRGVQTYTPGGTY